MLMDNNQPAPVHPIFHFLFHLTGKQGQDGE